MCMIFCEPLTAKEVYLLGKYARFAYSQGLVRFFVCVCAFVLQSFAQVIPWRKSNV